MKTNRFVTPLLAGVCALWLLAVTVGMAKLLAYANTPGPPASASETWPRASTLLRDEGRATLVMFAHPECPCSRASLGELAILMAHAQGRLTSHVLFYRPATADPGWNHTDLWDSAAAIPGVRVSSDEESAQAVVFGALVSGQTVVYGADGRLMFSGGLTIARGHAGDNPGRSAILSLLTAGTAPTRRTPVFGCYLRDAP